MSSDVLASFSCLDELTQVIYQSVYRFVILSSVSDDSWSIHLGLSGSEGRWWHGIWKEADIIHIVGFKASDKVLEIFANKLAEAFTQGELYIGDWSSDKGARINLTFGPASKKPMHFPLEEMSPSEAASYATDVFLEIALDAQSRKCRLHPSAGQDISPSTSTTAPPPHPDLNKSGTSPDLRISKSSHLQVAGSSKNVSKASIAASTSSVNTKNPEEEIKALRAQLKKRAVPSPEAAAPAPRARKGASLANPNKKARKYQAIEFESDED